VNHLTGTPNGKFNISFYAPQTADLYDASIVVDNAATVQSPFAITVQPGVPDKTQCSVVGKTTFEAGQGRF